MAIDLGLKRIGLAFSHDGKLVLPLDPIMRKNRNQAASDLMNRMSEYRTTHLVVGIPIGGSSEDEMRRRAEHFVKLLSDDLMVSYQDEAFSSYEAYEENKTRLKSSKDGKLDSLSAVKILERFLAKQLVSS